MIGCNQNSLSDPSNGCGASTATNMILNSNYIKNHISTPIDNSNNNYILDIQSSLYNKYIIPNESGVMLEGFMSGLTSYLESINNGHLYCSGFWIEDKTEITYNKCIEYIHKILNSNNVIGFLNLNNGWQLPLMSWHWVTIIKLDNDIITIYDNEDIYSLNFKKWFMKRRKNGALTGIEVKNNNNILWKE